MSKILLLSLMLFVCSSVLWYVGQVDNTAIEFLASYAYVRACGLDWSIFRTAAIDLFHGLNPYQSQVCYLKFYNPVWTLWLLAPLALFNSTLGFILLTVSSFIALIFVSRKFGHRGFGYFLIAISAPHLNSVFNGNIEFLPWLGVLFPTPIALLFLSIKPQATIGVIMLLLYREYRKRGLLGVALTSSPLAIALVVTVLFYGVPQLPLHSQQFEFWFPYSLIVGIPVLVLALSTNHKGLAAFASPFLSTYLNFQSMLGMLFVFRGWRLLIAVALLYGIMVLIAI